MKGVVLKVFFVFNITWKEMKVAKDLIKKQWKRDFSTLMKEVVHKVLFVFNLNWNEMKIFW